LQDEARAAVHLADELVGVLGRVDVVVVAELVGADPPVQPPLQVHVLEEEIGVADRAVYVRADDEDVIPEHVRELQEALRGDPHVAGEEAVRRHIVGREPGPVGLDGEAGGVGQVPLAPQHLRHAHRRLGGVVERPAFPRFPAGTPAGGSAVRGRPGAALAAELRRDRAVAVPQRFHA